MVESQASVTLFDRALMARVWGYITLFCGKIYDFFPFYGKQGEKSQTQSQQNIPFWHLFHKNILVRSKLVGIYSIEVMIWVYECKKPTKLNYKILN